ncbi:MAG: glutathione transferase GstA [Alphaproteobacteria bacterium]|jgi:glutathione S-transferase|nr:glutathione transferase GstA [Alphaproteobacteria bacterium]
MKLYLAPGACSLADHIALHEAGLAFEHVKVDLRSHTTADGDDYYEINPKGYVPALVLDDDEILTENIAILTWIADKLPSLAPEGPLGRYRLLEMLAFISTEIHKQFKPLFRPDSTEEARAAARETVARRLAYLAGNLEDDFLFGDNFTTADAYLFVMLLWSGRMGITIPEALAAYVERARERPSVRLALQDEGLA